MCVRRAIGLVCPKASPSINEREESKYSHGNDLAMEGIGHRGIRAGMVNVS